ncbi:MAG TPA: PilZ domain-containing protein [Terriglobia bacterium]|jgi:hypothetical protein
MATVAERRKYRRYDLSIEVQVRKRKRGATPVRTRTKDISARGIYFDFLEQMEVGSDVDLELNLPPELCAGKNVRIRCHGRVVRLEKPKADGSVGVGASIEDYRFVRSD